MLIENGFLQESSDAVVYQHSERATSGLLLDRFGSRQLQIQLLCVRLL